MKIAFALVATFLSVVEAFVVPRQKPFGAVSSGSSSPARCFLLHMTSTPVESSEVTAKLSLLATARRLKEENGVFVIDKEAKEDLKNAVQDLEDSCDPPSDGSMLIGEWDLIVTTTTKDPGVDLPGPLKEIQSKISSTTNKYVSVQQRIKENDAGVLDRIDNTITYQPPSALQDLINNIPDPFKMFNVNPLDISKAKLTLIHKATLESNSPLKIHLNLQSAVLNVAGTSTYLDPDGKDITAINLPYGEFLKGGTFVTTYLDDTVRISRGTQGMLDILRVFVKSSSSSSDAATSTSADDTSTSTPKAVVVEPDVVVVSEVDVLPDDDNDDDDDDDKPSDEKKKTKKSKRKK